MPKRKYILMKKLSVLLLVIILILTPVLAEDSPETTSGMIPAERQLPLLVDDAGLLDDEDYQEVLGRLEEISGEIELEVAVVTKSSLDGESIKSYTDDFYDYNGYGYGDGDDGIMLLISMEEREFYISTFGYGITAFTDHGLEFLETSFIDYLSDGCYRDAFIAYAETCSYLVETARNDRPLDSYDDDGDSDYIGDGNYGGYGNSDYISDSEVSRGSVWQCLADGWFIILLIAFIPAIIIVSAMKSQLKSVKPKNSASDYTVKDSLKLSKVSDLYLYRTVTKVARQQSSSGSSGGGRSFSGGGSSMHTSSSGRSHGGRGGKF